MLDTIVLECNECSDPCYLTITGPTEGNRQHYDEFICPQSTGVGNGANWILVEEE